MTMVAALFVEKGDIARFMSRVSPCPLTGCWWWTGFADKDGYGRFQTWDGSRERDWRAHRFIYAAVHGTTGALPLLRHTCDQGRGGCVNPDHLIPGTQADNVRDSVDRGRLPRGERNHAATTTEAQARDVLRFFGEGMRQVDIARRLGLTRTVVWQIVHGKGWSWLTN